MGSILAATPGYDLNCVAQQAAASSEDHLLVPNAVTSGNDRVTRICGNTISTSVVVCKYLISILCKITIRNYFYAVCSQRKKLKRQLLPSQTATND